VKLDATVDIQIYRHPALTGVAAAAGATLTVVFLAALAGPWGSYPAWAAVAWAWLGFRRPAVFQIVTAIGVGAAMDCLSGNPLGETILVLALGCLVANAWAPGSGKRGTQSHLVFVLVAAAAAELALLAMGVAFPRIYARGFDPLRPFATALLIGLGAGAIISLRAIRTWRRSPGSRRRLARGGAR
jgi:cell shape-determining protein MreD